MAICSNCGRRIVPGTEPPLCSACAACDTMYDAIRVRLKRMLLHGYRSAGIIVAAALIIRLSKLFTRYLVISKILLYLAICEAVLTTTQYFVSRYQLKAEVREEEKKS